MSGGPSFGQKVANIQHMPVLIAATAASKEPPDGFLIKDIVKMTFESPQTRLFLQQYLLNSLVATNNVFVKMKVLKIFQVLLDDGHIEFKQNLRKHPEAFNEASKLRPIQPKDQKLVSECGRIRDMGNRVLDQLYSDTPELRQLGSSHTDQHLDTNLLDENQSGGSRIVGFGNTPAPKQSLSTTDKLKRMFGSTGGSGGSDSRKPLVYDPGYATLDPVPHNTSTHTTFTPQISQAYKAAQFAGEEGIPAGASHERGRAGGGWDDGNNSSLSQPLHTGYRHVHSPVANKSHNNGAVNVGGVSGGVARDEEASYTEQERLLVEEITAPGGVRAAPPRESLNTFINRCKGLDCLAVVEYLREKLQSDNTQVILRSLFVIEALLRSDVPDISSHLDLTLEELESLTSSEHSSIKAKATKILMQLTSDVSVTKPAKPVSSDYVADSPSQNPIVDAGGEREEPGGEMGVVSGEQQRQDELSGLFSGMAISGEKAPRPSRPTQPVQAVRRVKSSPPSARSRKQQQQQQQEQSAFGDLLGLSSESNSTATKDECEPVAATTDLIAEEQEGDDSLLMFTEEDDEEFDPLKRTGSLSQRTGSLSGKPTPPISKRTQAPPLIPSSVEPIPTGSGSGLLGDLSGLDLSTDAQSATNSSAPPSTSTSTIAALQEMLQPLQTSTVASSQPLMASTTPLTQTAQIQVMASAGGVGAVPMGVVYQGATPYAMGGVMQPHPSVYGAPGLIYVQQPMGQLGGVARPVQRAGGPTLKESTPPPADSSGFGFLGKSSKVGAFDFVQEEMKASKKQ